MLISTATIPGSAHLLPGKPGKSNNQDAIAMRSHGDTTVIVLTDGCGSQPKSETGADIGANLIANTIIGQIKNNKVVDWANLPQEICTKLSQIIQLVEGNSFDDTLLNRFMFTVSVVLLHEGIATVAFFGDGMMIIDDLVIPFEPPISNTPPYIGYLLRADSPYHTGKLRENLKFQIVYRRPFADIKKSLVVATDGIRDLPLEDIHHPGLLSTQNALQFWLSSQNLEYVDDEEEEKKIVPGPCRDDVTLVLIRTAEAQLQLVEGRAEIVKLKIAYNDLFNNLAGAYEKWRKDRPSRNELDKTLDEFFKRADILYKTAEAIDAVLDCKEISRKVHEKIADLRAITPWQPSYGMYGMYGSQGAYQSVHHDHDDDYFENESWSPAILRDHRALPLFPPPVVSTPPTPAPSSNRGWIKKKKKSGRR